MLATGSAADSGRTESTAPLHTVDTWGVDEGLPQGSVVAMVQTHDGYLWVGTLNGLVRFDGVGRTSGAGRVRFPVFNESNTEGLKSSRIVKLFEDKANNLWICTENAGVSLADPSGKVSTIAIGDGTREGRIKSICQDKAGAVWLYTANGQLCRYQDRRVDVWSAGTSLSNARFVLCDDDGLLWVGNDFLMSVFDPTRALPEQPLPTQEIPVARLDFMIKSAKSGFWVLAGGSVQKWVNHRLQSERGLYAWPEGVPLTAVVEDAESNLLVGTYGQGVFQFHPDGRVDQIDGISQSAVLSMAIDREGTLWVGTDSSGLCRVKRQSFQVLNNSAGAVVQSIVSDDQGGLYVGYNWQRVDHWTPTAFEQITNFNVYPPQNWFVRSVLRDSQGEVWAGTWSPGGGNESVNLFKLTGQRFEPERAVRANVSVLFQDRSGSLWAGSEQGLFKRESSRWKAFTTREGLTSDQVRALAQGPGATLWIGTENGGLNRLDGERVTSFRKKDGLPSDNVLCLYAEDHGPLWIGTSAGLCRFEGEKIQSYSDPDGLLRGSISYIIGDTNSLWLGSTAGLIRVPREQLAHPSTNLTDRIVCRVFGKADGLPAAECSVGSQPAACRGSEGRLWFSTIRGAASVVPSALRINSNPPPVAIENVLIDGVAQGIQGLRAHLPSLITVPPRKESVEIDYTSLNLSAPERARFRYRLVEGQKEAPWTDAHNSRTAHYPKLPPGNYRFEVTACNEDGIWNLDPAVISIRALPPFWRTTWFLSLSVLVLLGLTVATVHFISTVRLHRQLENLRQQEALERERARIARDLHDQLGANLTQVALLSEMAEADKDLPNEVEAHARQIAQAARDTTHALDEIVWTVNPSNDTLDGLINYVCKYAQDYFALAGLKYRLEVPSHLPATPISPELRHNVFLAAKESINNIVKHAEATSAWLRLFLESGAFRLEIEDNGRGLPPEAFNKGRNGLKNMARRMEEVGGKFEYAPGSEGGTRICLSASIENAGKARLN